MGLEDTILKVESVVNYIPRQCGRCIQRGMRVMTDFEDAGTIGKVFGVGIGYLVTVAAATKLIPYDNDVIGSAVAIASPVLGIYRMYTENKRKKSKLTEVK